MAANLLRCVAPLALALSLPAHGGMYRGPTAVPAVPLGPGTGGGPGIPGAMPTTGGGNPVPTANLAMWQYWWEHNKDPYLRLREKVHAAAGGAAPDDQGTQSGAESLAPTEAEKRDVILPALERLLRSTDNRDVQTACMVAMAKLGVEHPDFELLQVFRHNLSRPNQEVRETAALCLGIAGRPEAMDDLVALATDDRRGRELAGQSNVQDRTRAFAIYGIGFLARRTGDSGIQSAAFDALAPLLADRDLDNREIRVALVHALGLLRLDPDVAAEKRLLWRCLAALDEFYAADVGVGNTLVQSHVPTAIARLIGRGREPDHERYKKAWVTELVEARGGKRDAVYQSLVLALGKIALPREQDPSDAPVSEVLERYYLEGKDQQARYFAVMSLAEIGGEANREFLLKEYVRGQKATEKPWLALALGVLAHGDRAAGGPIDTALGHLLHRGLVDVKNEDHRSASAIALGLAGYTDAARDMRRLLRDGRKETVAGYLSVGLALMEEREALPDVRQVVAESVRRPLVLTQGAIALALLGEKAAVDDLLRLMKEGDSNLAKLASIATAFRYVGDRRAIEPLVRGMFAADTTTLSRAFLAAALGGIGDKDDLPWNAPLAVGVNYRAVVDTLGNGMTGVLDIL